MSLIQTILPGSWRIDFMKTQGFRKDNPESQIPELGQYGRDVNGDWFGMTPTGLLSGLAKHEIVENPDLTITVSPSILTIGIREDGSKNEWHGYLRDGVWEDC